MESSVSTWDTRKTCQIKISFASFVLHIVLTTICTLLDHVVLMEVTEAPVARASTKWKEHSLQRQNGRRGNS